MICGHEARNESGAEVGPEGLRIVASSTRVRFSFPSPASGWLSPCVRRRGWEAKVMAAEGTDLESELVERVAAIDVAKASGMVCTRIPHESRQGRRVQEVWNVVSTTQGILELGRGWPPRGSLAW